MAQYELNREQLLAAIRHDCETFLGFYLGEELDLAVPDFHSELWDEFLALLDAVNQPDHLIGVLKKLMAVPREHAKTTLTKLAVLLFLRYSRLSFCAYTSNTFPSALNAIRDIRNWFMSERDQELYGPANMVKSTESEGLFILEIHVPGMLRRKRIILKAFGQGTQIRGTLIENQRPDFLVFDDIETKETADSKVQQAKLDAWAMGTALKAMARRGLCVFIGNMIADTTLLARLSKEPEWQATVLGAIVKDKAGQLRPLWDGRWTLEELLENYASYRRIGQGHTWEAEMMNLTNREVFGESLENAIRTPIPMPEDLQAGFLCLDPAFGKNAWNDESAITVHGLLHGGDIPVLIEARHDRWGTDRLFEEMLALSLHWGIKTWAIESVAAQQLLIPLFQALMIQRKISVDLFMFLPVTAKKDSKASRIIAFRNAVAAGSYAIADSAQDVLELLQTYAPTQTEHDDIPDSAAYGLIVWAQYAGLIAGNGTGDVAGLLFGDVSKNRSVNGLEMGIP